ncbi:FAD-dependent monooxygenase [Paraglaciecola aquimarina]|uniref:FAD-dependent monooxygenase n=1 Tax=Paraglaciecola algarum TaxID=3050085 RepID=A0ABS9DAU5_9ALTE|nr:FAD-dependent monooxygenase [Paraglaciecola sp. G1-23]MCF2950086.1 FAD-dependent monooxygenase [Paraglaciecola sp. G1-23]
MFDFCIVGGGMIGASMALGLSDMGFNIALVEAHKPEDFNPIQLPDRRVSAINVHSEQLLTELGAWDYIQQMRSCVYKRLSVWNEPTYRTDFDCQSISRPHLGHIIENRIVQLGLHKKIESEVNISCFWDHKVATIQSNNGPLVVLNDDTQISAKILIGADGGSSVVRKAAKIGVQGWQYNQQALVINIKTNSPQQDITWQQFTSNGPIAYLPLFGSYASLVWYNHATNIHRLKSLSKEKLKQEIVQTFPDELVDFEVLSSTSFPLTRMHANQYYKDNLVLVGDAAHTINPLAGQGVNLGFKDVAVLLTELKKQLDKLGHDKVLAQVNSNLWMAAYEKQRRTDNLAMMSAMDLLYAAFSNDIGPLKLFRNLGLKLANNAGPIKKQALKYAIGLS